MIIFTVMSPRRKLKRAAQVGGLVLLLGAVVPAIYSGLTEAEAMSSFAEGGVGAENVESGENINNSENVEIENAENTGNAGNEADLFDVVHEVLFGTERSIEMY